MIFATKLNNLLTVTIKLAAETILLLTENIKHVTEFKTFKTANRNLQTSTPNKRKEYRKAAYNMGNCCTTPFF